MIKMKRLAILFFALSCFPLFSTEALLAQTRRLDTTSFLVLGEGLAAGVRNFSLNEKGQKSSFPALMADQMETAFPQPLFQTPGLGNVVGFQELPVRIPATLQTILRTQSPPQLFVFNLSVPGMRLSDALTRRPVEPLIHQRDAKQTLINFILGFPSLILGEDVPFWTQVEYATSMRPTLALVELGYHEVLEAAVEGDLSRLPDVDQFRSNYAQLLGALRSFHSEVLVTTIPDPIDTAYFTDVISAAELLRVQPFVILGLYGLGLDDLVTVPGLVEMGNQFLAREVTTIPSGAFLPALTAAEISAYVEQLNSEILALANQNDAVVFDLHSFFRRLDEQGAVVNGRLLNAGFLGGLYSLNGFYPGPTGHALIANAVLERLNEVYGESFPLVDAGAIAEEDTVVDFRVSTGELMTLEQLSEFVPAGKIQLLEKIQLEMDASSYRRALPAQRGREGGRN